VITRTFLGGHTACSYTSFLVITRMS
jgi:hypothetical protein